MFARSSSSNVRPVRAPLAEGFLRWEADELRKFTAATALEVAVRDSPPTLIGGLSWHLRIVHECSHRTGHERVLGAYIICTYPDAKQFWRCDAQYAITLVNRKDASKSQGGQIRFHAVCYPDNQTASPGHASLVTLDTLENEDEGFVLDDKIILEAKISVMTILGVGIVNTVKTFSEPSETSDVCLIVDFKRVHVSKAVLAENSPVFKKMFYGKFDEHGKREIELREVNYEDFVNVLNIVYTSSREFRDDTVEGIIALADRFDMKIVLEAAETFLLLNSQLDVAKKLLITDTYRLENVQACIIYAIKGPTMIKHVQKSPWYKEFSDVLKARIFDRAAELP